MKILIKKITENEIAEQNIATWPIWSCEISEFDWEYDQEEVCYILEGYIQVITKQESIIIKAGDFVIFPKGLKCTWKVATAVKKHYKFN